MNASPHFTFEELTESVTAVRFGIDNTPNDEVKKNLVNLCVNILEPLRTQVKAPISILSGYRSKAVNSKVGGSSTTSQHMEGKAADIRVKGFTTEELYQLIKASKLPYDQLIQEFDSWVHISFDSSRTRRQNLKATKIKGKTVYTSY